MKIRRSARPLCLAASLFLLGPWLRPATAQLLGPEFQVNTYTTGFQGNSAVAADALGNFVVVWSSYLQDGSSRGVFGQRFNSAGSAVGSEFLVNSYTTSDQAYPAVAADSSGSFVVAWESLGQDGSSYGVFAQQFNSAGSPLGSEVPVNGFTEGQQRRPAVAASGSGNFVVVWDSFGQDGWGFGVFGRRYDSAGAPLGSEFQVNTYTANSQWNPAVAADGSGNFVVVWASADQDGSGDGVFGQRFNSVGSPVGSEFPVNTYTTNDQWYPAVAADGSGNFVAVWQSYGQDGEWDGVFGQRFNSVGSAVGSEFLVNSYTTGGQRRPAVAADGSGNFVVVWVGEGQNDYGGIFGQRFSLSGGPVGSEFLVNTENTPNQRYPAVAAEVSGNFVVVWESDGQDGSGYGVFGKRLAVALFSDGFESSNACAWSAAVGGGCP